MEEQLTPLWLINYKIEQSRVLDSKLFQLLGLLTILLSILDYEKYSWSTQTLPIMIILVILLIFIYLYSIVPRKEPNGGFSLDAEGKDITDYQSFMEVLDQSLAKKVRLIRVAYILFSLVLFLFLLTILDL